MKINHLIISLLVVLFMACEDPCEAVVCGANGTCVEGVCNCDTGVYGDNCENLYRDDFLGTWTMLSHDCNLVNASLFNYILSAGENVNEVEIRSSVTPNLLLIATIDENQLTIPSQEQIFGVPVTYTGSGEIDAFGFLELTIISNSAGQPESICTSMLFM